MENTQPPTIPLEDLTLFNGSYYLTETGEYVGDALPEAFAIKDDSSLEWVLEKFFNAEAELKAEAEKIEALIRAYEGRKKKKAARLDWLHARFSAEIEAYAKTKLQGKSKFVDTAFGRVAWRTVKGGLKVTDKAEALSFAKFHGWSDTIKVTEEFQISKLTTDQRESLLASPVAGFEIKPDSEVFDIKVASV